MISRINLMIKLLLVISFAFTLKNGLAQSKDEQAINAVVLDYIEGWYSSDTVRIANALSPSLAKRGFIFSHKTNQIELRDASYKQMIDWTSKKPDELKQNPNLKKEVKIIEIGENIAMVKTITPHFIDYIHLGKLNGKWKIFNVIWESNAIK